MHVFNCPYKFGIVNLMQKRGPSTPLTGRTIEKHNPRFQLFLLPTMNLFASLLLLLVVPLVQSLDISLQSFTCDVGLPIYAVELSMKCNGQTKCTFGETAIVYGEREYFLCFCVYDPFV